MEEETAGGKGHAATSGVYESGVSVGGRYRVVAAGGMGEEYEAEDLVLSSRSP